jgi:hypothetical protein
VVGPVSPGPPPAASVAGVARRTTVAAVATAAASVVSILLPGLGGLTVILALATVVASVGSALFVGLGRTASATAATVDGERVLAQGVGRGGRGFLGAHVVAVTEGSLASIAVRPWSAGRSTVVIRLAEVRSVESIMDYLEVGDGRTTITLKECPLAQVEAILGELRACDQPQRRSAKLASSPTLVSSATARRTSVV